MPRPPKSDENEKGSSEEEDSDSSGSNSDVSSQDDSSDVSDLEKFDEAYTDFGALTQNVDPRTLEGMAQRTKTKRYLALTYLAG